MPLCLRHVCLFLSATFCAWKVCMLTVCSSNKMAPAGGNGPKHECATLYYSNCDICNHLPRQHVSCTGAVATRDAHSYHHCSHRHPGHPLPQAAWTTCRFGRRTGCGSHATLLRICRREWKHRTGGTKRTGPVSVFVPAGCSAPCVSAGSRQALWLEAKGRSPCIERKCWRADHRCRYGGCKRVEEQRGASNSNRYSRLRHRHVHRYLVGTNAAQDELGGVEEHWCLLCSL